MNLPLTLGRARAFALLRGNLTTPHDLVFVLIFAFLSILILLWNDLVGGRERLSRAEGAAYPTGSAAPCVGS